MSPENNQQYQQLSKVSSWNSADSVTPGGRDCGDSNQAQPSAIADKIQYRVQHQDRVVGGRGQGGDVRVETKEPLQSRQTVISYK